SQRFPDQPTRPSVPPSAPFAQAMASATKDADRPSVCMMWGTATSNHSAVQLPARLFPFYHLILLTKSYRE
ncbi:hypothetical protein PENTCL1PPCAC_26169, partial [Pristionchus entomophagus]